MPPGSMPVYLPCSCSRHTASLLYPLVTPAQALLRYALPIDCKPIRQVQRDLEGISDDLRVPGKGVCCGGH